MTPEIFGATLLGSAVQAGSNYLFGAQNNEWAKEREEIARQQNYLFGEKSAKNADIRTRALYNDLYSPQAQMRQLKEAGLSPSLFYGDAGGISGQAGAQGPGATGINPSTFGIQPLDAAMIAKTLAETDKIKAETQNVNTDTQRQEIAKSVEELQAGQYKTEWEILNTAWEENGKLKSIFEAAQDHYTYESFLDWCRGSENTPEHLKQALTTETGQKILRSIYTTASVMHRDIMVLSSESISAEFEQQVIKAMKNSDFAKMNAQAAVQYLKANIETAELNETQKAAWNNLIDKLGKKGSTMRDIVVVLGMIINNAMCNWNMPQFNTHKSNYNIQSEKTNFITN